MEPLQPRHAIDRFAERHYRSLIHIAAWMLRRDPKASLQAEDLVNSTFRRFLQGTWAVVEESDHLRRRLIWKMRRILIDKARSRRVREKAGYKNRVPLDDSLHADTGIADPMDLRDAIERLGRVQPWGPRAAYLIDLVYYDGHRVKDAAAVVHLQRESAQREMRKALDWLRDNIDE